MLVSISNDYKEKPVYEREILENIYSRMKIL